MFWLRSRQVVKDGVIAAHTPGGISNLRGRFQGLDLLVEVFINFDLFCGRGLCLPALCSDRIANIDIKLWKNGATTLASKNSGGATYISNGVYHATLDATDTGTLGPMVVFVHVAGSLAVRLECCVYPANVYDALIAGTDWLPTTSLLADFTISGGTLTVRKQDGTTTQFTKTITATPGADPITGLD